jgi:hypothetical protein
MLTAAFRHTRESGYPRSWRRRANLDSRLRGNDESRTNVRRKTRPFSFSMGEREIMNHFVVNRNDEPEVSGYFFTWRGKELARHRSKYFCGLADLAFRGSSASGKQR